MLSLITLVCTPINSSDAGNIALNRPVGESSYFNGAASNVVDGNTGGSFTSDGCSETQFEQDPWWYVMLDDSYFIDHVVIYNRQDCCCE